MLHRELGGKWALLLPTATPEAPLAGVVRDYLGEYVGVLTYDGGQVLLIRPDGHLAWRGDAGDTAGLEPLAHKTL